MTLVLVILFIFVGLTVESLAKGILGVKLFSVPAEALSAFAPRSVPREGPAGDFSLQTLPRALWSPSPSRPGPHARDNKCEPAPRRKMTRRESKSVPGLDSAADQTRIQ